MFRDHENIHLPSSSSCAPQDLNDVSQFLMRRSMSISGPDQAEELQPDDDLLDDGCQLLGEKKRRLNLEQVKTLEKSFELGNKLEPERKVQLARALGLHPRQVAIWFQNRRARWKTRQLEKNYQVLKRQIESLKADNDALKSQNKKLQSQLLALKSRESTGFRTINLNKDNEGSWSNGSDHDDMSCHVNLNTTSNKNLVVFPSSIGPGAAVLTHVLHSSSKTDHFQGHKINNEPFSNMFVGLEENQDFWPWPEQQNFH